MYNQDKKDVTAKIVATQLNYTDVILASSQHFINDNLCMHIVAVMGEAHRLTDLSDLLTTIKGIKHGKLVMSRAD
jgi:CopG family nickel-responsive transcriptional regulator